MMDTTKTSRAAVFRQPLQPLELQSLTLPTLAAGEALVKISCCTICGSDLHTFRGIRQASTPTILGHEIIGHVEQVAGQLLDVEGNTVEIGDRISWSIAASCGDCFFCRNGLSQKCERLFKYGHEPISNHRPLSGGLAEYCHLVRGTHIVKLPESIPDFVASPANCATATVAAAFRIAGDCDGKTIVIHGAGMLGLTAAAMAQQSAARTVIVTDLAQQRLDIAVRFGATFAINVSEGKDSVLDCVDRQTEGHGADIVLEMSGSNAAIEQSTDLLRIGGRLILVGSVFPGDPVEILPEQIVRKLLRIEGVHNYLPEDLLQAVRFLSDAQQTYPFGNLVDSEFDLPDINAAMERATSKDAVRVAIRP